MKEDLGPTLSRFEMARARFDFYGRAVAQAMWERVVPNGGVAEQEAYEARLPSRHHYQRLSQRQRYQQRDFDESKHPRASAGRPDGGQFIRAQDRSTPNSAITDQTTHPPKGQIGFVSWNASQDLVRSLGGFQPKNRDFSTFEMDVAIGAMRGLWQSFYVDGLGGYPQLAREIAKTTAKSWRGAYSFFTDTLPSAGRQMGDAAWRYWNNPNQALSDADFAFAQAHERALKAGGPPPVTRSSLPNDQSS